MMRNLILVLLLSLPGLSLAADVGCGTDCIDSSTNLPIPHLILLAGANYAFNNPAYIAGSVVTIDLGANYPQFEISLANSGNIVTNMTSGGFFADVSAELETMFGSGGARAGGSRGWSRAEISRNGDRIEVKVWEDGENDPVYSRTYSQRDWDNKTKAFAIAHPLVNALSGMSQWDIDSMTAMIDWGEGEGTSISLLGGMRLGGFGGSCGCRTGVIDSNGGRWN